MTGMTWQEFRDALGVSTIALCVGSVEQHGPHMPLSVDLDIPYGLVDMLAEKTPLIIAPPIYYAGASQPATGGGSHFPGTTSIKGNTLTGLVHDVLADLARQGVKRFLIVNGHFENTAFINEAAREVALATGSKIVVANWWELVSNEVLDGLFSGGFPGWEVEHASLTETSLMMYFRPDAVHADRIPHQTGKKHEPRPYVFPDPAGLVPASGILFSADGASVEAGRALAEHIVGRLSVIVRQTLPS
jgi:creatinine amidohydrolase